MRTELAARFRRPREVAEQLIREEDLSLGTLQAGRVVCPWHNVPFDLRAGNSGCAGVGDLRLYALAQRAGRVTLEE